MSDPVSRVEGPSYTPDITDSTGSTQGNQIGCDSVSEQVGKFSKSHPILSMQASHNVFRILSPIAMSLTVSTKAELIIPG